MKRIEICYDLYGSKIYFVKIQLNFLNADLIELYSQQIVHNFHYIQQLKIMLANTDFLAVNLLKRY